MSFYKFGDHFKWFMARVSDIKDPEYLGRVRIRVLHDQTGELGKVREGTKGVSNDDLLWAWPLSGIQSASLSWTKMVEKEVGLEEFETPDWIDAVGISPTGIAVGTYVFGFYLDGHEQNIPIIFGTYHKKSVLPEPPSDDPSVNSMLQLKEPQNPKYYSDVAGLARGEEGEGGQTLPKEPYTRARILTNTSEPASAYKTEYPYNVTYTTKSGHAIELDDTPGHERLHTWHTSGSYEEVANGPPEDGEPYNGRRVKKTVGNDFEIVVKDKNVLVQQDENHEVGNTRTTFILKDDVTSVANDCVTTIGDRLLMGVGDNININVRNGMTIVPGKSGITVPEGSLTVNGTIKSSKGYNGPITIGNQVFNVVGGVIYDPDKT